jgi:exonuclease SbcC
MGERAGHLHGDGRPADELAEALREARAALDVLQHRAAALPGSLERADQAVARSQAVTAELSQARDGLTAAAAAVDTLQRDLESERAGLVGALAEHHACPCSPPVSPDDPADDPARLETLRRHHATAVTALQAHAAALEQESSAVATHDALGVEVQAALDEAGFATIADADAASLPGGAIADLRRTTTAWEQALATAQATLDDPAVHAAMEAAEPDVPALAAERDAARAELLRASSDDALLRRTIDGLARVRSSIVDRCAVLGSALAHHQVIRELADTLGGTGSNTLRMRLSAFVLAARLEKVVTLANERLKAMGDGRYQLRHTDGLAARGARSGLGLEVLDLWTGQPRDTSSLSGGESFMASLALALGLADAVREEAGGFDLQTLFVDEGFGTLDDESLEQVIEVLDALREGGRAVGVVSHVAELRSRIPSQVVVSKTERGSTVRLTGVDSASPAA